MTTRTACALAALLAASSAAAADRLPTPAADSPLAAPARLAPDLTVPEPTARWRRDPGPFLGPRYRYGSMWVVERVAWDILAIPANVPRWGAFDWAFHGAVTASVVGLMWPADPSPDLRIDRWIRGHVNPWMPTVWNDVMQPVLWGGLAASTLGGWWWAATHDRPDIAQGFSLMGESLAVSQAYHVTLKFFIGREGPGDGSNLGKVLGPGRALKYYPAGTPSGHAATLTSMLSSGLAYFDPPVYVHVLGFGVVGFLVAGHVVDHRHYLSDSLWGAAMGWWVGRWVVEHRASRGADAAADRGLRTSLVPLPVGGGYGLALVGSY